MKARSRADMAIISAINRGYAASVRGEIFKPDGAAQSENMSSTGYKLFHVTTSAGGERLTVKSHRFCAAYHYGVGALDAECIRHVNANKTDNSRDNLAPGTTRENELDKPVSVRVAAIAIASAAINQARSAFVATEKARKLTDSEIFNIRRLRRSAGLTYKVLGEMHGVCEKSAWNVVNGATFKLIQERTK